MNGQEELILYHGSYIEVANIDLAKCATGKDFGQGFYLTSDEQQARNFIRTSLLKAQSQGDASPNQRFGFVTSYGFHPNPDLKIYEFETADANWLWFVSMNRRSELAASLRSKADIQPFNADIVIGKIANDTTNPVITTYLNGVLGPVDSPQATNAAIGLLLPNRLKDQYCFRTQAAADSLSYIRSTKYDL